ncbi:hypothetical protein CDD82_7677 [Ophiocordyceps australis]|uniref:TRUD domain-containing protein n=1 Tax=Ophiocordyceps australis TaxID=1399860 RepID=A0A2C5ZRB7_9HYPO|nr:hypothetical protein CDD82_7677 [Ophiocordyceps australis]
MADKAQGSTRGSASHSQSIGIICRSTPLAFAWTADQRLRFSDFQVNEIGQDGAVLHLRHIGTNQQKTRPLPEDEVKADAAEPQGVQSRLEAPKSTQETKIAISDADVDSLSNMAGQRFTQDLVRLIRGQQGPDGKKMTSVTSDPLDDKSKRGQIHGEIRRIFKSRIETSADASGIITATNVLSRRGKKRLSRRRPEDKPTAEYLHFTLYKDNRDTLDAVNQIARALRIRTQWVNYAGVKDRRASTTQRCSVRHVGPRALAGARKLWGITTGDYEYCPEPINLGQLMGNEFVITLKNCAPLDPQLAAQPVAERIKALSTSVQSTLQYMACHGWINYFGHQRFGTYHIGTHEVGKLILGEKWEEAVMALLSFDADKAAKAANGEVPADPLKKDEYARHYACMLFRQQQKPEKAAETMPTRFAAESCILRHLTRPGTNALGDYSGALTHITRGLRSMYLHAYQSYVWNHVASKRWELYGDSVIKGDLVLVDASKDTKHRGDDDDEDDDVINPVDDADESPVRARPLTADEAASGRFSILDIVLPSPGYEVVYPDNDIGAYYTEFMARPEHGSLDPLHMRRSRREFSVPGRYRKVMARFLAPPSIDFRLYADDVQQMHPTDLDLVEASKAPQKACAGRKHSLGDAQGADPATKRPKIDADSPNTSMTPLGAEAAAIRTTDRTSAMPDEEPSKIAAVFKFQLGSSAYATVVLRELMGHGPQEAGGGDAGHGASSSPAQPTHTT